MAEPVQLRFKAVPDSGLVEAWVDNAPMAPPQPFEGKGFCAVILWYPRQGTMIGDPPRNESYAQQLNEAAEPLNKLLREFCT